MTSLSGSQVIINLDSDAFERREQIVDFLGGMQLRRKDLFHFLSKQISALFAHSDQAADLFAHFFGCQ